MNLEWARVTRCVHRRALTRCRECGGGSICEHVQRRSRCWICNPLGWARQILSGFRQKKGTLPDITAEELVSLRQQSTHCGCGKPLNWDGMITPHLHHNHQTGFVYGYVHSHCNLIEGWLKGMQIVQSEIDNFLTWQKMREKEEAFYMELGL